MRHAAAAVEAADGGGVEGAIGRGGAVTVAAAVATFGRAMRQTVVDMEVSVETADGGGVEGAIGEEER